jgi:hypothetical protein
LCGCSLCCDPTTSCVLTPTPFCQPGT